MVEMVTVRLATSLLQSRMKTGEGRDARLVAEKISDWLQRYLWKSDVCANMSPVPSDRHEFAKWLFV